mgnify:FL=1|tara:strand:- start:1811 stop:2128 length:318 start_codon:yes stop_codon:yes gene_type:complete
MTDAEKNALDTLAEVNEVDGAVEVSMTLPRWDEKHKKPIIKINAGYVYNWLHSKGYKVLYKTGDDIRNNLTDALRSGSWRFTLSSAEDTTPPEEKPKATKKKRNK